jgi:hypothetical protein
MTIDSRWAQQTLAEIVNAFGSTNAVSINELDGDTPLAKRGRECEQLFTSGVIQLRMMKDLPLITDLMADVWGIYHYRHVVMALGPDVPSPCIAVVQRVKDGIFQALTFVPYAWPEMIKADPTHELGAIITVGSQSVDFYNNKLLSEEDSKISKKRSLSYEAEFIHILSLSGHNLNDYQKQVLAKYPNGFDSSLAYARKPVAVPYSAN